MGLPSARSLAECASFAKTVSPVLSTDFRQCFTSVKATLAGQSSITHSFIGTCPLVTALYVSFIVATVVLVVSEINRNYSQIDRLWSILPSVYNVIYLSYAVAAGLPAGRIGLATSAGLIWSTRLTYNYWRRGGYKKGSEDYRWSHVRDRIGSVGMLVLNVLFISFAQSVLLYLITTPMYILLLTEQVEGGITCGDCVCATLILVAIAVSTIADEQQWRFQNAKHIFQESGACRRDYKESELRLGFPTTGLFAWVRKPNYTAEQCVWLLFYVWSCVASRTWFNWTATGAISYVLLFQASTSLTEKLSSQKYPQYRSYCHQVGKFLPKSYKRPTFREGIDRTAAREGNIGHMSNDAIDLPLLRKRI